MPNIGDSITLDMPVVGTTLGPSYATKINQAITDLKDILEQSIPLSSLSVAQDLSMRGGSFYYDVVDINALSLVNNTVAGTAVNASLYFINDELYVLDGAGNQIALTSGGAATGSTATNGIASTGSPTYNDNGEVIEWDGTNGWYTFYEGSGDFSPIRVENVLFANSGFFVTLDAPVLAASYTLTLPDALPSAGNQVVSLDNTGQLDTEQSLAAFSLATSNSITLSGTGRYKKATSSRRFGCSSGVYAATSIFTHSGAHTVIINTAGTVYVPVLMEDEFNALDQILLQVTKTGTGMMTLDVLKVTTGGSTSSLGTDTSIISGVQNLNVTSIGDTIGPDDYYVLQITTTDNGDFIHDVRATFSVV